MKTYAKYPIAIVCIFTWIGFVCAISFMEAWLKFKAPGISIPLGLGIGRLVFSALNKVEWVFAIVILLTILFSPDDLPTAGNILFVLPLTILLLQTFWLLPALDARAQMQINGTSVAASNLHIYFVGMEVIKVCCLFITGISFFKSKKIYNEH